MKQTDLQLMFSLMNKTIRQECIEAISAADEHDPRLFEVWLTLKMPSRRLARYAPWLLSLGAAALAAVQWLA